jgi:hypothetical protein
MYVRSISATATDGRWRWYESGLPFEFEQIARYAASRKRDRFDRDLLMDYLDALGIPVRDEAAYGRATLLQDRGAFERGSMTSRRHAQSSGSARPSTRARTHSGM